MSSGTAPSRRRQTALAVIDTYNKWDLEAMVAIRTEDCVHQVLPQSLGRQPLNNAEYKAYFATWIPLFKDFTVTVNDLVEDEKENKVVMWAKSTAMTEVGPYANEYVLILHMNEAGDKITKFLEFVDSQFSVTFFTKLREHQAQKANSS
ncbi:hypothetical protein F5B22DRAFT_607159 [Xylaria bambusicola]|uniref:uncharacterized protein n=1 Tax=Xylaria bambusicola TaxID=326684 RepID=UPI002007C7FD|nr:uncharacterized protein F5B22DRAFT_607159 [Xylaria bambusicola]KAI0515385.1 hypothetical protein F5B22DRAFT_607159 [Xylaria bambusicola]